MAEPLLDTLIPDPVFPPITIPTGLTFTVHRATKDDMRACARLAASALGDELFNCMRGTGDPALALEDTTFKWTADFDNPGRRWYMVKSSTGEVAAIAKWMFPHSPLAPCVPPPDVPPVPGTNAELGKEFMRLLLEGRDKNYVKDEMFLMNILSVHPNYQRMGLGEALLRPVLGLADEMGLKAFIESTAMGLGLYKKFGWVPMGELALELGDFDEKWKAKGGRRHVLVLLMRAPGAGGPGLVRTIEGKEVAKKE